MESIFHTLESLIDEDGRWHERNVITLTALTVSIVTECIRVVDFFSPFWIWSYWFNLLLKITLEQSLNLLMHDKLLLRISFHFVEVHACVDDVLSQKLLHLVL